MKRAIFLSVVIILASALIGSLAFPTSSASADEFPRESNGDSLNAVPIPVFDVMPEIDSVQGWKWLPDTQVTIAVGGSNHYYSTDSSGYFDTGNIGIDIKAGDLVQVSDGTNSKVHTVYPLDLYSYNLENDTLGGMAQPNSMLGAWVCTEGSCYSLTTTADGYGNWEIDFTGVMDIAPGSDGELWQPDSDDDYTVIFWQVPLVPTANVGLVADPGGFDDDGLNEKAYQGLLKAQVDFGINPSFYTSIGDDYVSKLNECVSGGNELCIADGYLFIDAIMTVANANPTVQFAILDSATGEALPPNLRSVLFKSKQVGYLAGALAGKMTVNDIVGTVGGMDIPPVSEFMEGYRNGAECANSNIIVLNEYAGTFVDPALGASMAADMIAHGADVIFGVAGMPAGTTGYGTILYTAQHDQFAIGVDNDGYLSIFGNGTVDGSDKLLTSAMKRYDNAVYMTVEEYLTLGSGAWGITVEYGLVDRGIGLAPYHETDSIIPTTVKDYVIQVEDDIISGAISVDDTCTLSTPTAYVGLLTNSNGITNDTTWNGLAYRGMIKAHADLGIYPKVYEGNNFSEEIGECVTDGNALCIGTSFEFGDPFLAAASTFPTVKFADLDFVFEAPPDNLRGIRFEAKEAAYLAGALAGKMTTTNKVGGVGGMEITPVIDLIEGYQNGAQCANPNATVLKVYTGTFVDPDLGAATAANMIAAGADVILGAGGLTGNGAILYSTQHDTWGIGVDSDQYISVFGTGTVDGSGKLFTSAMKKLDNAVYMTISDYVNLGSGIFGGNWYYGLDDGGVGLAPFHETDDDISAEIKAYLLDLETKIINGTVTVNVTCLSQDLSASRALPTEPLTGRRT